MHESFFSYDLSRPYPFKWFTPAAIILILVFTALFSFLNVAATGYELKTIETPDPNTTVAARTFFSNWPSFMTGNSRPSCESKILGVSNVYYTSNSALSYKLESISQAAPDGTPRYFGDLPYHNNTLRDCYVSNMEIFFQGLDRSALQISRQQWGAELRAEINCTVDIPEGSRTIKLTTTYDFNGAESRFPGRDKKTKPSLYWGESLLAWYYIKLTRDVYMATRDAGDADPTLKTYKGYVQFYPPGGPVANADEYKRPTFFANKVPGCFFVPWSDDGISKRVQWCEPLTGKQPFPGTELWTTAATIGKVFHSTVLADLGQKKPNILADRDLLLQFTKNITAIATERAGGDDIWGWGNNMNVNNIGLAEGPYTEKNAADWKLAVEPSFMSVTYLCQVPRIKSTGSLVFSVLIADFVLLQVLWRVFILIVDFYMYSRYPNMGACQGCPQGSAYREEDSLELLRPSAASSDSLRTSKPGSVYSPL